MKILISNDDGVYAEGIKVLYQKLGHSHEALTIAPLEERSTSGHSLSLDRPLRAKEIKKNVYGCSGFPADCILLGLGHFCLNQLPDLVVSGINRGANLGQDLYYSGTVAAAREAAFHGYPSIAVSLVCEFNDPHDEKTMNFSTAADYVNMLIENGIQKIIPEKCLLNINVPDLPKKEIKGAVYATIGHRRYSEKIDQREDTRGRKYYWAAGGYLGHAKLPLTDCQATDEGHIAVTVQDLFSAYPEGFLQVKDFIDCHQSF